MRSFQGNTIVSRGYHAATGVLAGEDTEIVSTPVLPKLFILRPFVLPTLALRGGRVCTTTCTASVTRAPRPCHAPVCTCSTYVPLELKMTETHTQVVKNCSMSATQFLGVSV